MKVTRTQTLKLQTGRLLEAWLTLYNDCMVERSRNLCVYVQN